MSYKLIISLFVFIIAIVLLTLQINPSKPPLPNSLDFEGIIPENSSENISILVTGDIMPGRYVNIKTKESGDDMWAYKNISKHIDNKFIFSNLESPITAQCKDKLDGMIFCAPEYAAKSLSTAGIDIVSLANNHILNQGVNGLIQTQEFLDKYNVKYVGVTNPTIMEINRRKVAFLAFDDVECNQEYIECATKDNIASDITESKKVSDTVVIMFHWGAEYRYQPTTRQIELAHFSIDNGADLVLGNHPHWYQKTEEYKGKLIAYSHGNFIFDQMWSKETREGVISEYTITSGNSITFEVTPILISNYGQPELYEEPHRSRILNHFKSISLTQ